ncbi:MAG: hypothetical protein V1799_20550 [bacterium]
MRGNICPQCGKEVMPYRRFFREAEPYKVSQCGSCDTKLKRSPRVYLFLLFMCIVLTVISIPLVIAMVAAHTSFWIMWPALVLWAACWVLLINYSSWRYIGWVVVKDSN